MKSITEKECFRCYRKNHFKKLMDIILKQFTDILCGVFDNQAQVDREKAIGKQVHPYAKHITELCSHKVLNRPNGHEGAYVLEESYYTYFGKETQVKPLCFYLRSDGKRKVFLQSLQIPNKFSLEEATHANKNFILDYNQLFIRPFGVAEYTLMETGQFTTNHIAVVGLGMTLQLIETLSEGHLSVMEIVRKDGVNFTPYDTPIEYIKIK